MGLAAFITVPLSLVFAVCMMRGYKEKMAVYLRSGNEMNCRPGGVCGRHPGHQGVRAGEQELRGVLPVGQLFPRQHPGLVAAELVLDGGLQGSAPLHFTGHAAVGAWLYMQGTLELPLFLACIIIPFGFMAGLIKFGLPWASSPTWLPTWTPFRTFSPRRSSAGLKSR